MLTHRRKPVLVVVKADLKIVTTRLDRVAQGTTVNCSQTVVMFYLLTCAHHSNKESATRIPGSPAKMKAGDDEKVEKTHHPSPLLRHHPAPWSSQRTGTVRVAHGTTVNCSQTVVRFYSLICAHYSNKESATRIPGSPAKMKAGDGGRKVIKLATQAPGR